MATGMGEPASAPPPQQRAHRASAVKKPIDPADGRRPLSDIEVLYAFDEFLYHAMRRHAAVLARHDAMPMLVRSLDFLLGHDATQAHVEEGMLEREFRLVFNCIYLQLLFSRHDEGFIHSLELGQGRLGASLVSLLFEATKMCAENDRIPIKKVVLLLLLVLQCLLAVPDSALSPSLTPQAGVAVGPGTSEALQAALAAAETPSKPPQVRDFQAFAALHLHEQGIRQKYGACNRPAAIEEALTIIQRYEDDFMKSHAFHPSEITFMRTTEFLQDAHARYEELTARGGPPKLRTAVSQPSQQQVSDLGAVAAVEGLGTLADKVEPLGVPACRSPNAEGGGISEAHELDGACSDSEKGALSDASSSDASIATVVGLEGDEGAVMERAQSERPAGVATPESGPCPSLASDGGRSSARKTADVDAAPLNHSPLAVFQRLYLAIFPCLTETVVLLLRLLLTSCSNVENYPGVVDMARERHVTAIGEEGAPERTLLAFFEKAMPDEITEAQRHREIMAAAVSGIVLILLKQARRSAAEQFSSLAQLITDSNGALVVLKFLNQDLSSAMEPRSSLPVLPCLQMVAASDLSEEGVRLPSWPACATLRLLEVLYLLCKDSPERVRKYLIHYKAPFILKRLHRIENDQVQRLVLKLLRKQVRYLPRKWKQTNMKAISAIYTVVPMSPLEDWLLNEPLYERFEGPSQADVRASNGVYNAALLRQLTAGTAPPAGGGLPGSAPSPPPSPPIGDPAPRGELAQHSPDAGAGLPPAHASGLLDHERQRPSRAGAGTGPRYGEQAGEEALGYAELFPEYVPAFCG